LNWNKLFLLFTALVLLSCGIDEVVYLEPVESGYVTGVSNGYVRLPDNNSNTYFRYYMIYYRIYTSDTRTTNIDPNNPQELRSINPVLETDYNSLNYYITNENVITNSMDTIFENRQYYQLYASDNTNEIAMYDLLSPQGYQGIPGVYYGLQLNFNFPDTSSAPFISMGDPSNPSISLNLLRNSDKFTVIPQDRLFFRSNELVSNVTGNTNKDVNLISATSDSLNAYVSMYIIACGINNTFSPVFSRPKHIGIFWLPSR